MKKSPKWLAVLDVCVIFIVFFFCCSSYIMSACNKHKPSSNGACIPTNVKSCGKIQSRVCDGSEGPDSTMKIDKTCTPGGAAATDHCVMAAVECGYWYKCKLVGSNCGNGDTVKIKVKKELGPGEAEMGPTYVDVDKPYEASEATSTECPPDLP